jgi:hypothetical protein
MKRHKTLAALLVLIFLVTIAGFSGVVYHGSVQIGMSDGVGATIDDAGEILTDGAIVSDSTVTGSSLVGTDTAANVTATLTGDAGYAKSLVIQSGGVDRWSFGSNSVAEAGADAGSNLVLSAFTDAGVLIDSPMTIARVADGAMTVNRPTTLTDKLTTKASASGGAGLIIPHGAAPSSPVNGDIWTTSGGLYARINSLTVGPFASSAGASVDWSNPGAIGSATPNTGAFTTLSASGALSVPSLTLSGNAAVNGGDITTTDTSANIFNTGAKSLNIGGESTATAIGATTDNSYTTLSSLQMLVVNSSTNAVSGQRGNMRIQNARSTATGDLTLRLELTGAEAASKNIQMFRVSPAATGDTVFTIFSPNTSTETFEVDAKTGNTTIGGDITAVTGGDATLGVSGTTRGALTLNRGASTNTPGYATFEALDGTEFYAFGMTGGALGVSTTIPDADADGWSQTIDPTNPPTFSYFNCPLYYSGTNDSAEGKVIVYGGDDYSEGGRINIYNHALEDTPTEFWEIEADAGLVFSSNGTSRRFHIENTFVAPQAVPLALVVVNWSTGASQSVAAGNVFRIGATNWTAGNDITTLTGMPTVSSGESMEITIIGGDTDCNIVDGGRLRLNGNWNAVFGATLKLIYLYDTDYWYEISRSANG